MSSLFGLELLDVIRERVKEELRSLERELLPEESKLEELEKENLEEQLNLAKEEKKDLEDKTADLAGEEKDKKRRTELLNRLTEIKNNEKELQKKHDDLEKERDRAYKKAQEDREIQKAWEVKASFWQPWQIVVERVEKWEKDKKAWLGKKAKIEEEIAQLSKNLQEIGEKIKEQETKKNNLASYEDKLRREALPLAEEARAIKRELQELEKDKERIRKKIEELEIILQKEEKEEKELERKITEEKEKIKKEEEIIQKVEKAEEKIEPLLKELGEKEKEISLIAVELKSLQKDIELRSERYRKLEREGKRREKTVTVAGRKENKRRRLRQMVKKFALWELEKEWEEKGFCPLCGSNVPPPSEAENLPEVDWECYHSFQEQGEKLVEEESSLRQEKTQEESKIAELKNKEEEKLEKKKKLEEEKNRILEVLKNIDLPPLVKPESIEGFLKEKRGEREKALFNLYQLEKNREVKKAKIESRIKEKDEEQVKIESIEKNIKEEEKFLTEKREQLSQIFAVLR